MKIITLVCAGLFICSCSVFAAQSANIPNSIVVNTIVEGVWNLKNLDVHVQMTSCKNEKGSDINCKLYCLPGSNCHYNFLNNKSPQFQFSIQSSAAKIGTVTAKTVITMKNTKTHKQTVCNLVTNFSFPFNLTGGTKGSCNVLMTPKDQTANLNVIPPLMTTTEKFDKAHNESVR